MTALDDYAPAMLVPGDGGTALDLPRGLPQEELLALLGAVADRHIREARPVNTRLAYADDWKQWTRFCERFGVEPVIADEGLFYTFVQWLIREENAVATIERRLSGVTVTLRDNGIALPPKGGPTRKAWLAIDAYDLWLRQNNITRGRGKAPHITRVKMLEICERVPTDLYGLRAKAVLLLGVNFASRRSEVADLDVTDIVDDPGRGLKLTVRASKGGGSRTVPIGYGRNPLTCPVLAWYAWRDAAGITAGPAFCQIRARGCHPPMPTVDKARPGRFKRLTGETIGSIITGLGRLVGLDLTGHSVRAAFVTAAFEDGHSVEEVAAITGHSLKSGTVYDYKRVADMWRNSTVGTLF